MEERGRRARPPIRRQAMSRDGILGGPIDLDPKKTVRHPVVEVLVGTPITHAATGVTGKVAAFKNDRIEIVDGAGKTHSLLRMEGSFVVDGVRCTPVVGKRSASSAVGVSASGSVTVRHEARVARGGRILVEGVHDAELVEKIWGDDLRHEGIVIERLDGMDDLTGVVRDFGPSRSRRLGVLLDHLVDGTKESRVAAAVRDDNVLIAGHPYVDVWQAVKPSVAGIEAWPDVPMGESWKEGVLRRIGRADTAPGEYWRELLGRVEQYRDLETPLINAVERLIDFVTV